MSTIAIEGMTFRAYHGCMEEEQVIGNTFVVDLYMEADTTKSELSDDLNDTVDYAGAYKLVKKEMKTPSKLLEHVGKRILDSIEREFSDVKFAELKVSKMNPPVEGQVNSVSVTLFLDKDEIE